ncbi:hypothetical protein DPEC_G00231540 [Dallia pectoralis]|uniref:Uncharacterized protein n=1 Tax=Dallia pectoralis TaxID=75939 RepID=A0ACC2FWX6_DALPE|nr:hypothetical protein DPEC_G00231540 [Dallia pectoralis]
MNRVVPVTDFNLFSSFDSNLVLEQQGSLSSRGSPGSGSSGWGGGRGSLPHISGKRNPSANPSVRGGGRFLGLVNCTGCSEQVACTGISVEPLCQVCRLGQGL